MTDEKLKAEPMAQAIHMLKMAGLNTAWLAAQDSRRGTDWFEEQAKNILTAFASSMQEEARQETKHWPYCSDCKTPICEHMFKKLMDANEQLAEARAQALKEARECFQPMMDEARIAGMREAAEIARKYAGERVTRETDLVRTGIAATIERAAEAQASPVSLAGRFYPKGLICVHGKPVDSTEWCDDCRNASLGGRKEGDPLPTEGELNAILNAQGNPDQRKKADD